MSNRQELIVEIIERLGEITIANGFQTDAGLHVFTHETPEFGPDDPEQAIAVVIGDDDPRYQGEQVFVKLPVEIQALAKVDSDPDAQPYLTSEAILADIKKAMELADRTLGGLVQHQMERGSTRTLAKQPGSLTVGVAVTYVFPYPEVWGNP